MLRFEKTVDEEFVYSVGFAKYLTDGVTMQPVTSASFVIEVYEFSDVADATPTNMIDVPVQKNAVAVTIKGAVVPAGAALLVSLKGGVQGCTYRLSHRPVMSNGEKPIGDALLTIKRYAPYP
jgi:hypothetical protein